MPNPNGKGNQRKRLTITLMILGLLTLIIVSVFALMYMQKNDQTGDTVIEGTVTCLPHKNPGDVETMECAFGVQADDNRYYALEDLPPDSPVSSEIGAQVIVTGNITEPQSDYNYDVAGIISVESIQKK